MKPTVIMVVAGEPSGDALAANLVRELRHELMSADTVYSRDVQPLRTGLEPRFFGAGGPRMQAEGVELAFDMTPHSVVGVFGPARKSLLFLRRLIHLRKLATQRQPDVVVLVDFSYFNHLFARMLKRQVRHRRGPFNNWQPKIVKFVSPQVWASRPGRAYRMPREFDLLLSIVPFEKEWYAKRVPELRVEFVGHPLLESEAAPATPVEPSSPGGGTSLVLLPGSRVAELQRHLPVMLDALKFIQAREPNVRPVMILPSDNLLELARSVGIPDTLEVQVGNLSAALARCDVAIASSGTVTLECAFHSVPTVVLYKVPWYEFAIAKRLATVDFIALPNLLAKEELYPELLQNDATPEAIARATLDLLENPVRRAEIHARLEKIVASFGGPGASRRAARAIVSLIRTES